MKLRGLFILLFVFFSFFLSSAETGFSFKHLTIGDGLSQGTILAVLQDSRGFIWLGTLMGLNRYDGRKVKVYKHSKQDEKSVSHPYIRCLAEDSSGNIWIGTIGGGLNRYDRNLDNFTRYSAGSEPGSIAGNNVAVIIEDRDKNIWVGTDNGLTRISGVGQKITNFRHITGDATSLGHNTILAIAEGEDGDLWIGTARGLNLFEKKKQQFREFRPDDQNPQSVSSLVVTKIHLDQTKSLWVGTYSRGLNKVVSKKGVFKRIRHNPADPGSLSSDFITDITSDHEGKLWITTRYNGLNIYDPKTDRCTRILADQSDPGSLSSNQLGAVYQSRDRLIWVGTRGYGVNVYNPQQTRFYHDPMILPGHKDQLLGFVWDIDEENENSLWLTTLGGLVNRNLSTGTYKVYKSFISNIPRQIDNKINSCLIDQDNTIWLGSNFDGVYTLDKAKGTFIPFYFPDKAENFSRNWPVSNIYQDSKGIYWFTTSGYGLISLSADKKTSRWYLNNPSDPTSIGNNQAYVIREGPRGYLWLGSQDLGLGRLDPKTGIFKYYQPDVSDPNSISSNIVVSILVAEDKTIWLGTMEGGLNRFDPDKEKFTSYTTKNGMCDDTVYCIVEDEKNRLWLSTNRGISLFDPKTEKFKNFSPDDGLQWWEFNTKAGIRSRFAENKLLFGGPKGYNTIDTRKVVHNTNVPPVVILSIRINNRLIRPGQEPFLKHHISETEKITLSYNKNNLTFEFGVLSFTNPANNKYSYRLLGLNPEWFSLGNNNELTLAGIKPGNYTLQVKGANEDNVWNEKGASLTIVITPPFWGTWWFSLIIVLLVIVIFVYWHITKMERLARKLKSEAAIEKFYSKYNITEREKEVIELILMGKNNKEIEDDLYISLGTVKNYTSSIYSKLNVNSRAQLMKLFFEALKSGAI